MAQRCNIDAKGKAVRLVWGIVTLLIGVGVAIAAALDWWSGWPAWTVAGVSIAAGLLGVYEARAGWCVVRAMGFKTPI